MTEIFRSLSVCSGIEAFSVATEPLDFEVVGVSEIEDFPSKVLAYRYPDVPNLGDMTLINPQTLGRIDWLVGGTPCQSFSVAGLRRGLDDDRGNLSLEYVRLAHELAEGNGLRGFLWENVPGVLSDKSNAFGCFLGAVIGHDDPLLPGEQPAHGRSGKFWRWIEAKEREPIYDDEGQETGEFTVAAEGYHRPVWPSFGMASGPRARVAWRVLDSRHFGVAQRRRRVFVVADFGNGFDPATVLFEPRGQGWSAATSGETGQEVAGTLAIRATGGGGLGTDMDLGGGLQPVYEGNAEGGNADLPSINASNGKKGVNNQTPLVSVFDPNQITSKANGSIPEPEICHTLPAASNAPVAFGSKDYGADAGDISPTLKASGHVGSHANGGAPPAVAIAMRGRADGVDLEIGDDQANALRTGNGGSSKPMVFNPKAGGNETIGKSYLDDGSTYTMDTNGNSSAVQSGPQVRRLTPEECEKLQGYPVGWTRIPGLSGWRVLGDDEDAEEFRAAGMEVKTNKKTGKSRVNDPDGPRYKALGNSFTTEPVNWIMSRVQASLRGEPMPRWQPMQLWNKTRP